MSEAIMLRSIFSGTIAAVISWTIFSRYDEEIGVESGWGDEKRQKYLPHLPATLLPLLLLSLTVLSVISLGPVEAMRGMLSICFGIFLQIGIYYAILLPLLPLFRSFISARACATLWLLPTYLYFMIYSTMALPEPRWVIRVPGKTVWILCAIWFMGFVGVMLWRTMEHFIFRRQILRDAREIFDPEVRAVWEDAIAEARIKNARFKLVRSPHIQTPLSIGLFKSSTRVVLPERRYTKAELELVFRHEIIHIAREDAWAKWFQMFCAAMCWFNPFMWVAMRKSAEDVELSCDETVLLHSDMLTRKKYGALLLETAGDRRGFTTYMSSAAGTMRYRLTNILQPRKRSSGALLVGAIFFLLCMTSGYVALAYEDMTGMEVIYSEGELTDYRLHSVRQEDDPFATTYDLAGEEAFHRYLAGLQLTRLTGNYTFDEEGTAFSYIMDGPKGTIVVGLHDHSLRKTALYGEQPQTEMYYVPDGIDWEHINTCILPRAALEVTLFRAEDHQRNELSALLDKVWRPVDGGMEQVYDSGYGAESYGHFSRELYTQAELRFSQAPITPCTVEVESWNGESSYIVLLENTDTCFRMDLPGYTAHYTVCARFLDGNGEEYEAAFRWDLGDTVTLEEDME